MTWMNAWSICEAENMFQYHPVLGPATRFLREFAEEVNAHSDGWPYWTPPSRAASKLMEIIEKAVTARYRNEKLPEPTRFDIERTIVPIKSFMTKRGNAAGMKMPTIEWATQQRLV